MDYCGLDLGRSSSRFWVVDKERNILRERDVATSEPALRRAFERKDKLTVVVEASTCAFWVADVLSELGHIVHVVDPNRTKAIGHRSSRTTSSMRAGWRIWQRPGRLQLCASPGRDWHER